MKKNKIYNIEIEDLSSSGEGVGGKIDGFTVFVPPQAIPGDKVRARITTLKKSDTE